MQFRNDIQGLRAVAVLAVIAFHLNSAWLPGGFVGVDVFLVISGFLIASILIKKKDAEGYQLGTTLNYFYTSRIKRIAPAYYAALIVTSIVAAVLFLPNDFKIYQDSLKQAAYFNSNNYFATFGDYFAPASYEQPLLHTWSLAVELQFYLLAPFIFLLIPKRALSWLLPLFILSLTAYAEYQLQAGVQQATYYSLAARLPAFFIGGWIALIIGKNYKQAGGGRSKLWMSALALGLLGFSFINPRISGNFPGLSALIPTLAAALLIYNRSENTITKVLSSKAMVWVGGISYSLYLWHWPVLALIRYYTGTEILDIKFSLAFIVLTLGLSVASYYWVETPLRTKRSTKQILGYVSLVLAIVLTATGMKKINTYYTPEPLPIEYTRYGDDTLNCHGHIVGDCFRGDLNSNKEVLVLGDSHAAMLNHYFDYLGKELHFKARIITASSCVTIPGFDYQRIAEWAHKACLNQIAEAEKHLADADTIFLAASWNWHLESKKFEEALSYFMNKNTDVQIYIISQEPLLDKNPMRNRRFSFLNIDIPGAVNKDYLRTNDLLRSMTLKNKNSNYLELDGLSVFSNAPMFNGVLTYYDEHHLNEIGIREYAKQSLLLIRKEIFNVKSTVEKK